ncbi:interleukin-15 receptor subunit alpha isoform X2 [Thunnus thynnus]|uniref:interleukin-15 receptor subunit alpha isoform X2 n=1 Tax=Thunnus thynnus TaxID=8237 RepID=UPI0035276747
MELGSLSFSVCVIMICLPGAGHCSNGDIKCPCPEIPTHPLTQPPESECRQINSSFRYKCIDGYVRKARSSNLIRCEQGSAGPTWSKYKLECIRDPKITTTKPPKTTATKTAYTDTPHDSIITITVNIKCPCSEIPTCPSTQPPGSECRESNSRFRYKCIDGYVRKAGSSNLIRCTAGPTWSECKLECIRDPKITTTKPPKTTATRWSDLAETAYTDTPHDSIITITVTPSTSQQTTQSASISTSMTSKTGSTEPTSSGPVQWSLSDDTQDEKPQVTRESVTVTSATARTVSTSTLSLSTVKSNITLIHEYSIGNRTRAAVISCVSLFIIVAMIGILYYRRRSVNNMPPQITEEEIPMNPELASVCDVKQGQSLPGAQEISIL